LPVIPGNHVISVEFNSIVLNGSSFECNVMDQFSIKKIVLLEFNLNKMAHLIHFNIHSPSKKRINCNHSNSAAVALVKFQPEEQSKI